MRPEEEALPTSRGPGLRAKLALGFVVLLAILLAVGVESITLLDQLGGSIDVILRENYRSVVASERMKEALERMDSGALFALAGEERQGRTLAAEHRPRFEEALKTELGNITLPGEGERAARVRSLFAAYVPVLERVLDPAVPFAERRAAYFGELDPTFQRIKSTADEILQMNQQNMAGANDRARALAAAASRRMAVLLLAGTAFAGLCVFFLSRSILAPLERLARAAGEIERGNLDLTVPLGSQDELGQLAAAFNSMAGGLKELRQSDQAQLLRARRTAQLALDSIPEAMAVISPARRVELANRAAVSRLGLTPGEPLPERGLEWLPPLLQQTESGRLTARGAEARVQLAGGGFVRPRVTLLRDSQGRPEALLLKDVARLEESRSELHAEAVAPGDLIAGAVRQVEPGYREGRVRLTTEVDPAVPPALADLASADLVLASLLRNALAHTAAGGSVTVKAEPWEGRVRFTVADTGRGIPAEHQARLFEPFYQVPGTQHLGGVGLGLSTARDVVRAHGGEIYCESAEGRGASFWFTLPAAVE